MATTRLYGQELRTQIVALLTQIPQVKRINYLEYWNDHNYLIFLDPNTAENQQKVEAALKDYLNTQGASRHWTVQHHFKAVTDPVPSSITLYRP